MYQDHAAPSVRMNLISEPGRGASIGRLEVSSIQAIRCWKMGVYGVRVAAGVCVLLLLVLMGWDGFCVRE